MITIKSEAFISDKGKNETNEDFFKYLSGKFYLVCDGVGGYGNGFIASELLSESKSTKDIVDDLNKSCQIFSNDNYTAIIFQVDIKKSSILV